MRGDAGADGISDPSALRAADVTTHACSVSQSTSHATAVRVAHGHTLRGAHDQAYESADDSAESGALRFPDDGHTDWRADGCTVLFTNNSALKPAVCSADVSALATPDDAPTVCSSDASADTRPHDHRSADGDSDTGAVALSNDGLPDDRRALGNAVDSGSIAAAFSRAVSCAVDDLHADPAAYKFSAVERAEFRADAATVDIARAHVSAVSATAARGATRVDGSGAALGRDLGSGARGRRMLGIRFSIYAATLRSAGG